MKKILLTIAALLTSAMTITAQNDEGDYTLTPKVGMNMATWAGDPDAKMMFSHMGGVELEYGLTENIGLIAGVHYSMQGEKDDEHNLKMKFDYTNVPLLVQYYPVKGLAVKTGVQLGFLTRKKFELDGTRYDLDKLEAITGESAEFRNFDLAIPLGISYELNKFVLDARYNLGLIGVQKEADTFRNSVFQISLGYKFTLLDM